MIEFIIHLLLEELRADYWSILDVVKMEDKESYKTLMRNLEMKPPTYEAVATDWEKNLKERYHALIAIADLPIALAIPNLKVYAWCRYQLVADDGSEAHFH